MSRVGSIGVVCLLALALASSALAAQDRTYIVRFTESTGIEVWEFADQDSGFERIWESTPIFVSEQYRDQLSPDASLIRIAPLRADTADIDNDGTTDLVAVDKYGIMIYGSEPAYIRFPEVAAGVGGMSQVIVVDLDGDDQKEIVVQRSLPTVREQGTWREISIWRRTPDGFESAWSREFQGPSWTLLFEDVDNDGAGELITASDTIVILDGEGIEQWEVTAEIPNIGKLTPPTVIDVVRVADLDGDGDNEIVATGNSGLVTVYEHRYRRFSERSAFPVVWQSRPLVSPELEPALNGRPPSAFTQGLGVGDLNSDGMPELIVGTMQFGQRPGVAQRQHGQIHVFEYAGPRWFERRWESGWTSSAGIPAISIGDVDRDGSPEWIYNGYQVYGVNPAGGGYVLERELPGETHQAAIVTAPFQFNEPLDQTRLVPVKWDAPRSAEPGQTLHVSVSVCSVWADSHDVNLRLLPNESWVRVVEDVQPLGTIVSGAVKDSLPFTIKIAQPSGPSDYETGGQQVYVTQLMLEISASDGYRQTVALSIGVRVPPAD